MATYVFIKWLLRIIFSWPLYIDVVRHDYEIESGKIFAVNHPSTLDPVMMLIVLNEKVSTLITQSVFAIPIVGWMLRKSGHIPVIEGRGRDAYEAALQVLRTGRSILIFPEGRLSAEDGSLETPFSGAVRLSVAANVPIIPVGVSYTKDRVYRKKFIINDKFEYARFYLLGRYNITFGKPMYPTEHIKDNTLDRYKSLLMRQISQLSEESAIRLYSR